MNSLQNPLVQRVGRTLLDNHQNRATYPQEGQCWDLEATIRRIFESKEEGEESQEHIIGVPKPDMVIQETDTLVVFGTLSAVKRFLEINS